MAQGNPFIARRVGDMQNDNVSGSDKSFPLLIINHDCVTIKGQFKDVTLSHSDFAALRSDVKEL